MERFLWDIDLEEYIATINPVIEVKKEFITYYDFLSKQGNHLVSKVSPSSLVDILPQLMAVDEKCTLVIFYICNSNELENGAVDATIELIEKEYKKTHREKYIFEMSEYESWSIAQRIS